MRTDMQVVADLRIGKAFFDQFQNRDLASRQIVGGRFRLGFGPRLQLQLGDQLA